MENVWKMVNVNASQDTLQKTAPKNYVLMAAVKMGFAICKKVELVIMNVLF